MRVGLQHRPRGLHWRGGLEPDPGHVEQRLLRHPESITFTANAGTLYTIAVDGNGNATGQFTLSVSITPLNDNWVDAVNVAAGGTFAGFNINGTGEAAEPDHGGVSLPLNSVWYKLTVATPTKATIDTCGSAFNTVLAAYTGASVSSLTPIASNNDSCATQSQITFVLTPGTLYTVVVDGFGAATGLFTLHVTLVPANDNWVDAINVGAGGTFTGTNVASQAKRVSRTTLRRRYR